MNFITYTGKLIGGLDILKEMAEEGKLQTIIEDENILEYSEKVENPSEKISLNDRIASLINKSPIMLFMKVINNFIKLVLIDKIQRLLLLFCRLFKHLNQRLKC